MYSHEERRPRRCRISSREFSSCGVSPLSVPLSLFADGTGFVKLSSAFIYEKENSAFSFMKSPVKRRTVRFHHDLQRSPGNLVRGKVSIQDTGYLGKVLSHGSTLALPLARPWSNAQPALYKTRISLVDDSCGPVLPSLGPIVSHGTTKACLRTRSVLWVM